MEVTTSSTQETKSLAKSIARKLKSGDVLLLFGDLGSGKTTFVRFLVEALGSNSRVQSPTFIIARKYTVASGKLNVINHLDLYRIRDANELVDLGIEELLAMDKAICIIEWPEVAESAVRETAHRIVELAFSYIDLNARKIIVSGL